MKKSSIKTTQNIVFIGLFTAIIAVLSQIAIPLPTNVPVTLQTFAIALAGYFLGWIKGTVSIVVYILLGAVGAPVFANWKGGFGVLTGYTGGFIFGFILFAFLCGIGSSFFSPKKLSGKIIAISLGLAGLLADHVCGVLVYAAVAGISLSKSFLTVSLPFLLKDVISVLAAYFISEELVKRLAKMGSYSRKSS